jgi:hypothetical protein
LEGFERALELPIAEKIADRSSFEIIGTGARTGPLPFRAVGR